MKVMETKKLYFMDCHLAGRMYHDADEVWDDLKVGTILRLERDKDNRHDVNAVMVVYEKDGEEYKIGYIPRGENETLANFLEMGWNNIFECRICKINDEAHPEKQVHLTIKIKRNKEQYEQTH
jgi:hypothetical protein